MLKEQYTVTTELLKAVENNVLGGKIVKNNNEFEATPLYGLESSFRYNVLQKIDMFIMLNGGEEHREDLVDFCEFFITHFTKDEDEDILETILYVLFSTKQALSQNYFLFWKGFLKEAASVGFPALGAALHFAEEYSSYYFKMHVTDVRVLLAFKIYIADITQQLLKPRKNRLNTITATFFSGKSKPETTAHDLLCLFGSMPLIENGKVKGFFTDAGLTSKNYETSSNYSRNESPFIYMPDMESAQGLIKLGQDIFNRPSESPLINTFQAVCNMTKQQAEALFPDLFSSIEMSNEKKTSSGSGLWHAVCGG
jgi:hypothetical protein